LFAQIYAFYVPPVSIQIASGLAILSLSCVAMIVKSIELLHNGLLSAQRGVVVDLLRASRYPLLRRGHHTGCPSRCGVLLHRLQEHAA